jgi:ankyrin repeat protein
MNLLLFKGANIDSVDQMWLVKEVRSATFLLFLLALFLERGADIRYRNEQGWSALTYAIVLANVELMDILCDTDLGSNPLKLEQYTH